MERREPEFLPLHTEERVFSPSLALVVSEKLILEIKAGD
jgi:hypothetical protein